MSSDIIILAYLDSTETEATVLSTALAFAKPLGGHIDALFVTPDFSKNIYAYEEVPTADAYIMLRTAIEQRWTDLRANMFDDFEKWRVARELDSHYEPNGGSPSIEWRELVGDDRDVVKNIGHLADIIVMGHPNRQSECSGEWIFEAALGTGRPVVLAQTRARSDLRLEKIFIAWNSSPEAARAVSAAMPLLRRAIEVTVFSVPDENVSGQTAEELVEDLNRQGVRASVCPNRGDNRPTSEAVLAAAKWSGADLLVMGAYTHTRLHELVFGGVTRHVLDHATLTVFMSH